jgi:hypothetical protein
LRQGLAAAKAASTSQVLGSQACTTTPSLLLFDLRISILVCVCEREREREERERLL